MYKCDVAFTCPLCKAHIKDAIEVPEPHWIADRASDMCAEEDVDIVCDECDSGFWAHVLNVGGDCTITLRDYPETNVDTGSAFYDAPEDSDDHWLDDILSKEPYSIYLATHGECARYLFSHGGDGSSLINRMVFSQYIAALEAYLSDTLIGTVIDDKSALIALSAKDKRLTERKFSMSEFIEDPDLIRKMIAHLKDVIYHDLHKVDYLYRIVFEIDLIALLGSDGTAAMLSAVKYRHDCVHRNGKNKEGEQLDVFTKEYVTNISQLVFNLVDSIQKALAVSRSSEQVIDVPFFSLSLKSGYRTQMRYARAETR
jgi:hypothetical protein